jgi:HEAT repeat protein
MGDLASVPTLLQLHAEGRRLGVRDLATAAKAAMLQMGEPVLPQLSSATTHSDVWVRRSAAEIRRKMRQRERRANRPPGASKDPFRIADRLARDLAPRLADRTDRRREKRDRNLRCAVEDLQQLRRLPPESVKAHVALIEEASFANSDILRGEALATLFHALGAETVPRLLAALKSSAGQMTACRLLARLGDAAPARDLVELLRDPNEVARANAARTLGLLRRKELFPILASSLSDPSPAVRVAVCGALAESRDLRGIPELIRCLQDHEGYVRREAVLALGRLSKHAGAPPVIPELIRCLEDTEPSVRDAAVEILGELYAEEAVPALERRAREDSYSEEREWKTWMGWRLEDWGVADVYPIREAAAKALDRIRRAPHTRQPDRAGWQASGFSSTGA